MSQQRSSLVLVENRDETHREDVVVVSRRVMDRHTYTTDVGIAETEVQGWVVVRQAAVLCAGSALCVDAGTGDVEGQAGLTDCDLWTYAFALHAGSELSAFGALKIH